MSARPRVVFGLPLFNRAAYLPEALESILGQSHADFRIVMVDDCSTDATEEIVRAYRSMDPRISYQRNGSRLGMVRNWRRAFDLALAEHPSAEYFAWASDHDVWHPRWLVALLAELDSNPSAVLAYPLSARIDASGDIIRRPWTFDTSGVSDPRERLWRACMGMSAGNMVYGLFRPGPLARAGVLRSVLLPDRLLLAELSLFGEFRQVPELLWFRRFADLFSLDRQRASFFPEGSPPYTRLPCAVQHTGALMLNLGLRGTGQPQISRSAGLGYSLAYVPASVALEARNRGLTMYRLSRKHSFKAAKQSWRTFRRRIIRRVRSRMAMAIR